MDNGTIRIPPDSTGKMLDTGSASVDGNTVLRQRVQLAGTGALDVATITNTTPDDDAPALVVRIVGGSGGVQNLTQVLTAGGNGGGLAITNADITALEAGTVESLAGHTTSELTNDSLATAAQGSLADSAVQPAALTAYAPKATSATVANGTYTVGKGTAVDGTITVSNGIITGITQASNTGGGGGAYTTDTYSMQFDGTNYLTVDAWPTLTPVTAFTIEFWYKSSTGGNGMVTNVQPWSAGWGFFDVSGAYGFWLTNGSGNVSTSGTVSDGNWHHIALTWDLTSYTLWMDGTQMAVVTSSVANGVSTGPLTMGYTSTWGYTSAIINEFRISQVCRYASSFTPATIIGNDGATLCYLQFEEGTGDTVADTSANGRTGNVTGTPIWVTN